MIHLPVLTASETRTFRRCMREHHYSYRLGYRSAQRAQPLAFGTLVHVGLEAWWSHGGNDRLAAAIDAMATLCADMDPFDLVTARVLLHGYDARWGAEPIETVAVESEFRCNLTNPATGATSKTYSLGGKIDAIARKDGQTFIIEHKTTSEEIGLGSPYWQRLRLDSQVSVYFEGARSLGHDVAGCIYDVIRKPGIRPLKATPEESRKFTKTGALYATQRATDETPEEYGARLAEDIASNPDRYYQRGTVVRLDGEMADAAADVWQIARVMRESELESRYPRNPDACMRYGRPCDFFDVCTGAASLDDETRFRRASRKHEELAA